MIEIIIGVLCIQPTRDNQHDKCSVYTCRRRKNLATIWFPGRIWTLRPSESGAMLGQPGYWVVARRLAINSPIAINSPTCLRVNAAWLEWNLPNPLDVYEEREIIHESLSLHCDTDFTWFTHIFSPSMYNLTKKLFCGNVFQNMNDCLDVVVWQAMYKTFGSLLSQTYKYSYSIPIRRVFVWFDTTRPLMFDILHTKLLPYHMIGRPVWSLTSECLKFLSSRMPLYACRACNLQFGQQACWVDW